MEQNFNKCHSIKSVTSRLTQRKLNIQAFQNCDMIQRFKIQTGPHPLPLPNPTNRASSRGGVHTTGIKIETCLL